MDLVQERAEKRRKYVRDRTAVVALSIVGAGMVLGFGGLVLLLAILLPNGSLSFATTCLFGALALGVMVCYGFGARLLSTSFEKSKSLVFVPPMTGPIRPTTGDRTLLRASSVPATSSRCLLRSVGSVDAMRDADLLRADSTEAGDQGHRRQVTDSRRKRSSQSGKRSCR
jgi:hypothetical protein